MASGDPTRDRPSRSTGQSRNPEASPDQATQATPSAPRDSSVQRSRYTFEDPTASNSAAAGHPTPGRSETTQQDGLLSAAAQLDIRDGAPETPPMALPLLTHLRDASLQRERGGSSGAGSPTRAASPRSVGHMTPRTQASNSPRSSGRRSGDAPAAATGGSRGPIADPKVRVTNQHCLDLITEPASPLPQRPIHPPSPPSISKQVNKLTSHTPPAATTQTPTDRGSRHDQSPPRTDRRIRPLRRLARHPRRPTRPRDRRRIHHLRAGRAPIEGKAPSWRLPHPNQGNHARR